MNRLLEEVSKPFQYSVDRQMLLSASIGVTGCPQQVSEPWTLIQQADEAMYEAKRKGRNQYCLSPSCSMARDFREER